MSQTDLKFIGGDMKLHFQPCSVAIIGQLSNLKSLQWSNIEHRLANSGMNEETWKIILRILNPQPTQTYNVNMNHSIGAFSKKVSRNNMPSAAYHIPELLKGSCLRGKDMSVIMLICKESEVFACGCEIARCFPSFSLQSSHKSQRVFVELVIVGPTQCDSRAIVECMQEAADSVRTASRIVDTPTNFMTTDHFVESLRQIAAELQVAISIYDSSGLHENGFNGILGVGKSSTHPPYLVVLSHIVHDANLSIAWCGEGVMYDTGGLAFKTKNMMFETKRHCAGAAAIAYAFRAIVKRGFTQNLHCVLCIAENSIGQFSARSGDVHFLYSGKSVEVVETEGGIVLGDGVAYASKDLKADIILDMATFTKGQEFVTGRQHAAILTNSENWEKACVLAGKMSGDLVYPIIYCPELHFSEFNSTIADMTNSTLNTRCAQASCAGLFIGSHLVGEFSFSGIWMHIDMAGLVHRFGRATGYGVSFLLVLFGHLSKDRLLQYLSPHRMPNPKATNTESRAASKRSCDS